MSTQIPNTTSGNGAPLIINGGIGGVAITGGAGGSHGDGGSVNLKAGDGGNVIETNEYPGGPTWVDREYDPYFMELPPDEKFRRLKAVGQWFKKNVLAAVVIFILTTILGIYITRWLSPSQDQNLPPISEPKAMPV